MKFGRLLWGTAILFIGVLLLGINFGWWDENVWQSALELWPLLLILIGAGIIFGQNSPIPVIILAIISILGILYVSNYKDINTKINPSTQKNLKVSEFSYNKDPQIKRMHLDLVLGAMDLKLGSLESPDKLYTASLKSNTEIKAENNIIGDVANIKLSEDLNNLRVFGRQNTERNFSLNLNKEVPIEVTIDAGASKLDLDFSSINLTELQINAGASKSDIKIGSTADNVKLNLSIGASKSNIAIPKGFALSIISDSALLNNNFDTLGLQKKDDVYRSDDFGSNVKQIELKISAGASTINIERY